jgi:hypothetical protein
LCSQQQGSNSGHRFTVPSTTHKLNAPAEKRGLEILVIREVRALEDLERVDDRETAVELAAGDVVVEVLGKVSVCGVWCYWR